MIVQHYGKEAGKDSWVLQDDTGLSDTSPCDAGESSVPLQIPASDRKAIPFLMKHHYCYCKPLPLGNHPHPSEDREVPGKKNRSPAGAWAHSSLPELLAIFSQYPCIVKGQRSKREEGWCKAEQL